MRTKRSTILRCVALVLALVVLASCGGGPKRSKKQAAPSPTGTSAASPSPSASPTTSTKRPTRVLGRSLTPIAWGVHPYPGLDALTTDTDARKQQMLELEAIVGRKYALDREFYRWDAVFPGDYDAWSASQGRTMVMSWSAITRAGQPVPWRSIADGSMDAGAIVPKARAMKAFGHEVLFTFDHEPEMRVKTNGTPAEFVAAWKHVVDVFRREKAFNVTWVLTLQDVSFWAQPYGAPLPALKYFPGDAYVDWVGADGYNWYDCRANEIAPWRSFASMFGGARAFAAQHDKPMIVSEYGSVEDDAQPARKAAWIADVQTTLKRSEWSTVKALVYWNRHYRVADRDEDCDFPFTTSSAARQAFAAMGADSYFLGSVK